MLNQDSLPAKIFRSCIVAAFILSGVGVQSVPVDAQTEATYRKKLVEVRDEDGWVFVETCEGPAGGCYIVEG